VTHKKQELQDNENQNQENHKNVAKHDPKLKQPSRNKLKCSTCGKTFTHRRSFSLHIDRIHKLSIRRFKCPICPTTFKLKENLRVHLRLQHGQIALTNYVCEVCNAKFAYIGGFFKHFKKQHFDQDKSKKYWTNRFFKINWKS
jgi:uncharacterized C2H2 Zn-finger protein